MRRRGLAESVTTSPPSLGRIPIGQSLTSDTEQGKSGIRVTDSRRKELSERVANKLATREDSPKLRNRPLVSCPFAIGVVEIPVLHALMRECVFEEAEESVSRVRHALRARK